MCFRCVVKIKRYLWDGNVLLHEWEYNVADEPQLVTSEIGEVSFNKPEPINNLITWVYENGSFVPTAKLVDNEAYSIVSDYIGRPVQAYDNNGNLVWQTDNDIYGKLINLQGDKSFIPFRQLGQYEDVETGLYYNRFRYYDCSTGTYISKDPISILGGLNIYAYVWDSNKQVDIFGLAVIGLGLDNNLINHRGTGAIIYKNAGWQTAGLTKVDWGRASIDNYYFWESFKESAKNAEQIRFDISDFDMNYSKNSITKKEMEYILSNSEILEKTIFIKDGKEMVWNNKGFFECK